MVFQDLVNDDTRLDDAERASAASGGPGEPGGARRPFVMRQVT